MHLQLPIQPWLCATSTHNYKVDKVNVDSKLCQGVLARDRQCVNRALCRPLDLGSGTLTIRPHALQGHSYYILDIYSRSNAVQHM